MLRKCFLVLHLQENIAQYLRRFQLRGATVFLQCHGDAGGLDILMMTIIFKISIIHLPRLHYPILFGRLSIQRDELCRLNTLAFFRQGRIPHLMKSGARFSNAFPWNSGTGHSQAKALLEEYS
ncbi:hypothetical protein E2P81_ATG02351 [Venturia nashicola]|nr:hypothetical protein E2P81_ATG02351 [Venturia nashicola]